jgi:polygalacturonase
LHAWQNVLIEHNYINCGDDHVTILSGVGKAGTDFGMPSKNITVADNRLGSGASFTIILYGPFLRCGEFS